MARRCFLPSSFFFSCFVTVQSIIYGLKGQQVQLDPGITEQPEQILWIHNGNKVVEFDGMEEQVFGSYKGRVTLDWHSAQLEISDLHFEDSGKYDSEIYMDKNLFYRSYELKVIDKVAKPNITCQMNSSSSSVSAVLLCSVELNQTQSSLNFKWISKGNVQRGSQLTIFLGGEHDEEEYTCEVSNPASNETATFRAKDCNTDAGLYAGMIALIAGISTVIICVGLVILFRRLKHKNSACRTIGQIISLTSPEGTVDLNEKEFELKNIQIGRQTRDRQTGVDEDTAEDEEERSFFEDQPTASSPQPQEQLDTENDGVTEVMVSHQESCSAPQHSGSVKESGAEFAKTASKQSLDHFGSFQHEENRPELDKQSTPPSPPLGQLDTTKASEKEDRGAQSDAGGASSASVNNEGWIRYLWNKVPNMWPGELKIDQVSASEHEADSEGDEENDSQSASTTKPKHQER